LIAYAINHFFHASRKSLRKAVFTYTKRFSSVGVSGLLETPARQSCVYRLLFFGKGVSMFSFLQKKACVKTAFAGLILVLLVGFTFISCHNSTSIVVTIDAEEPLITTQPSASGGTWDISTTDDFVLTVAATSPDGGTLSYQWYENTSNSATGGFIIPGKTDATLTLSKTNYDDNGNYYFYVVVTNTNNGVNGNKTAITTSNVATVTVSGGTDAPVFAVPTDLIGTWASEYGEEFIINGTTFTSQFEGEVSYAGTIVNHRDDGAGAGYITIRYTENATYPDAFGYFYVIHYKNLTSTTMSISAAYGDDPEFDFSAPTATGGKINRVAAETAYTVTDGYFAYYSDCTKEVGTEPPEYTLPEDLKGTWTSEYGEEFIITDTTFTSQWEGDVTYAGTIVNHRADGEDAGYITIQYTENATYPDAFGYFYVIHYKNLTSTTMSIAGAYDDEGPEFEDGTGGKSTWQEAEAAYTVENDCYGWYSDCTKGGGEELELSITTQPQGGTLNITSGTSLNLKVVADNPNAGTLSYQWYSNTTNSDTGGTAIVGKTSDTLTITKTDYTTNRTFHFYVVVTNATSSETVTSNAVTVTITGSTTTTYFPWETEFATAMAFFEEGIWLSYDGYHIHKWEDFDSDHYDRAQELFSGIAANRNDLKTYSSLKKPANGDYVIMYDDDAMGLGDGGFGMGYMGLVQAINVSTENSNEGAFIIEYFEGTDPAWLWDENALFGYQGLDQGDVPFFGFYYKKVDEDEASFGNTTDQSANYEPPYYTETETLEEAINKITLANQSLYLDVDMFDEGSWHRYDCDEWLPVEGW
jgi:hypothetical protein